MTRFRQMYESDIVPAMMEKFAYKNKMAVPKIEKIVVNVGLGEAKENNKAMEACLGDIATITGQKPVPTLARKSVANFKLREGMPIGVKATLRGDKMYSFLDRVISVALPRVRDFQGVSGEAFDGRGNYTLGIKEQIIFPEISYEKIDRIRGMNVIIVTTAKTDEEAHELLRLFGMPYKRNQ
ncbi:MAG: 50S ribosomal protein L5 [Defluviitaleaceae bacterium]|nr:50S ribosomal protein L5 [Defluviitaleaceae bacterium]